MSPAYPYLKAWRWFHIGTPIIIMALLLSFVGSTGAAAQSAAPQGCLNLHLSGSLKRPADKTKAARQIVRVDANCKVIEGPIEEVPISAVLSSPSATTSQALLSLQAQSGIRKENLALASTFSNQIFASSEVKDPVGIVLNALYSSDTWTGDFSRVTGYRIQPSAAWHTENGLPGWSLARSSSGGSCALPCASVTFNQHAEFSYLGDFDPTGLRYYNVHDLRETLFGDSHSTCTFSLSTRTWFPGWTWAKVCR